MRVWARATTLVLCCGVLAAGCTSGGDKSPASSERGKSAATLYRHALFELPLPAGWRATRVERAGAGERPSGDLMKDAYAAVRFENGAGDFFMVVFDAPPTEMPADSWWTLRRDGTPTGLAIEAEEPLCSADARRGCGDGGGESDDAVCCTWGNGVLELVALGPVTVQGHGVLFLFGNVAREEGANLDVYRGLLRAVRAKWDR